MSDRTTAASSATSRVVTITTTSERPQSTDEGETSTSSERPSLISSRTTERSRSSSTLSSTESTESESPTSSTISETTSVTTTSTETTLATSISITSASTTSISSTSPNISPTAASSTSTTKKVPVAIIAGSAGGGVALLVILGLLFYYIRHTAKSRKAQQVELTRSLAAKTQGSPGSPQISEIPRTRTNYAAIPREPTIPQSGYQAPDPYGRFSPLPRVGDQYTTYTDDAGFTNQTPSYPNQPIFTNQPTTFSPLSSPNPTRSNTTASAQTEYFNFSDNPNSQDGTAYDAWVGPAPATTRQSSYSTHMSPNTPPPRAVATPRQSSYSSRQSSTTYTDSPRYYAYQPQTSQSPVQELESPGPQNKPWTPPNIGMAR